MKQGNTLHNITFHTTSIQFLLPIKVDIYRRICISNLDNWHCAILQYYTNRCTI